MIKSICEHFFLACLITVCGAGVFFIFNTLGIVASLFFFGVFVWVAGTRLKNIDDVL